MTPIPDPLTFAVLHEPLSLIGDGIKLSFVGQNEPVIVKSRLFFIDKISINYMDNLLHSVFDESNNLIYDRPFVTFSSSSAYVIEKMSHGFNRLGKAHGKGFFNYDTDPPTLWSGLKVFEKRNFNIPEQDITDRLTFATVIGALQTTEEEATTIDPEVKALIPPGFPLSRQEALSWIDNYGESRFAERMAELAAAYGKRFTDPRSAAPSAV
jgi:hypothetical protein